MSEWTDRLKSRKFLLALGTFGFAILTDVFGLNISPETWSTILTVVLGYIGIEGAADIAERIKQKTKA